MAIDTAAERAEFSDNASEYERPLPNVDWPMAREYWAAAKRHELQIQKCSSCGTFRWYPKPMCPACRSLKSEWATLSGTGTVYSYTIGYRAFRPEWRDHVPYICVVVELDDAPNVRLLTNLVDCSPEDVHVEMPVTIVFDDVTPAVTLPQFRPTPSNTSQ